MKKVILLSGKAQNGKDTVANIMKNNFESNGDRVIIAHYADLLKYICKTFFNWDGNKDVKGRGILQKVGTEIIRNKNPDFWVSFIIDILKFFDNEWDYMIIPDCRFPNEIDKLSKAGYTVKHVRINRDNFISPLPESQQHHISEMALDDYTADYVLFNSGTIDDLIDKVSALTKDIKASIGEQQ